MSDMADLEENLQLEREYDPDSLIGLLGRGSTAGSKLYRLYYGKPPGASVGNNYSRQNMERLRSFKSASTTELPAGMPLHQIPLAPYLRMKFLKTPCSVC